jgi:quinol monooxygenase YgiN
MVYTLVVHLRASSAPNAIAQLSAKLVEASNVYTKDRETLSWFVMQSTSDPREFSIVERYESEASQKYHLENPYWKTFDPAIGPLLEGGLKGGLKLVRYEELDGSAAGAEKWKGQ